MVITLLLISTFCFFQTSLADFDCQEVTNKTAKCRKELNCIYDDVFEVKRSTSYYCRCKTVITGLPFPENRLEQDRFAQICSKNEDRLEQLWVNDMELEYLDNEIFEKFPNLNCVNLAGNNIAVKFSEKAAKLTEVDLSDNKLNSVPSDFLKNLQSLEILNLAFNRLDVIDFVSNNTKLKEIYLNNNHINVIGKNEFSALCALRILNLAHNHLSSFLSLIFCSVEEIYLENNKLQKINLFVEIQNIKILNVGKNVLNDTNLSQYGTGTKQLFLENNRIVKIDNILNENAVVYLNLSNNLIKSIEANTFLPDNSMKILDLNSNKLNHIDPDNFQNFKNVTTLILSNNLLSEKVINCDNLQNLINAQVLSLSNNQIEQIYDCTFRNVKNLTKLILSDNKIEKIPSSFPELTKLQVLDLSRNKIKEIPVGVFDNLVNLEKLNLSYNQIKHFNLNVLNRSQKLTYFDISHNNISDLDLKLLIEKLPSLKVLDFDKHLVKCDVYSDIMQLFDKNSIVVKSCATGEKCCKESNFFIILIASLVVLLFAVSVLCCVLCCICYFKQKKMQTLELSLK